MIDVKISLLLPTYNSGATLEKALESIRIQSWRNVEVILIDGGSSDNTLKVAESNRELIAVVVSEPDEGIYDAINKGLSRATGDLIGVLGSDDELISGALEAIASAWNSSRTDIIAGPAIMVASDGSESMRVDEDYGTGALLSGIPFCHNAMFVTREAYQRVGNYDQQRYRICADADWVHRAIHAGCTCQQIGTPVVRFSLGGLSSNSADDIMRETYQVIAGNFPGLLIEDAERLFRAVRGWSEGGDVESILRRYQHNADLIIAAAVAFHGKARHLATATSSTPAIDSAPTRLWRAISRLIHQVLK